MANDRKDELVLLGELISEVKSLGKRFDAFSEGAYKRMGRAEEATKELAKEMREKRESDNKALNERLLSMDKQITRNAVIVGGGSALFVAVCSGLVVALFKSGVL